MSEPLQKYYDILGVNSTTRLPQIKAAYRRKAKLLHPDVNASPDSNAKFILLQEAYHYFNKALPAKPFYVSQAEGLSKEEQLRNRRAHAKKFAQERKEKQEEKMRSSKYYFAVVAIHALLDMMIWLGVLACYTVVIVYGTLYHGIPGLCAGILTVLITMPHAFTGFRNFRRERVK